MERLSCNGSYYKLLVRREHEITIYRMHSMHRDTIRKRLGSFNIQLLIFMKIVKPFSILVNLRRFMQNAKNAN